MSLKQNYEASVVNEHATWVECKQHMDADASRGAVGGFLVVENLRQEVTGTITDGDLRKSIKGENALPKLVASQLMNSNFIHVYVGMTPNEMGNYVLEQLQRRGIKNEFPITYIPILKHDRTLHSLIHISNLLGVLDEITRQVVILGQGFVGLTLAMAMVKSGLTVYGVEKDKETYDAIISLRPRVHEPQLRELLEKYISNRFKINGGDLHAIPRSTFLGRRTYVIAVGTPVRSQEVDLSQLVDVVKELSNSLRFGDLVIVRSTVPIGTTRKISETIREISGLQAGLDFHIGYAPERTVEGDAISEVTRLPQLVSGLTDECSKLVANFFSGWVSNVIQMENLEACEMAKLVSNAYRDSIFAFANEMAQIASKNNLDINRIILNANAGYARNTIPMPSPGVGGPCLTKDSYMLVSNHELSMVFQSRKINESMIDFSVKRILSLVEELGDNIVIIGAAFKGTPPTNDLRNSTPVDIARALIGISKRVAILDAVATDKEILAQGLHPFKLGEFIPNVICILNNHPDNKELLKTILTSVEGKSGLRIGVFDPWNLTNESDLLGTRTLVSTLSKRGV